MARTTYAHPVDVLRKFNPEVVADGLLSSNEYIGSSDDEEFVRARIEGVEDQFEDLTRNAFRERRVGNPGEPRTWEYHEADFRRYQHGVKIWLENRSVLPFEPTAGDTLEIRTGRDRWKDITDQEGDLYEADYREGTIRIYGVYRYAGSWRNAALDRNVRITYRHGALGGSRNRGGETSLDGQLASGAPSITVSDASRLPNRGLLLIGGDEYVQVSGKDLDTESLTGVTRGLRGTDDQQHADGAQVHYCPVSIREAVAARAAVELLEYDDWVDSLVEASEGFAKPQKVSDWNGEWEQALNKHSEARML